jgi:hypothetical protein
MVCYKLVFVVSTISFIAPTAVATERYLKQSKIETSDELNKDTDFQIFLPNGIYPIYPNSPPSPPPDKDSILPPTFNPAERYLKQLKIETNDEKNKDTDFQIFLPNGVYPVYPNSPPSTSKDSTIPPTNDPAFNPAERYLKQSKTETSDEKNKDTDFQIFLPNFNPWPSNRPPIGPSRPPPPPPPPKSSTIFPTKEPAFNPTGSPAPTDSPAGSLDFIKLSLQDNEDLIDAKTLFDGAVGGEIVTCVSSFF